MSNSRNFFLNLWRTSSVRVPVIMAAIALCITALLTSELGCQKAQIRDAQAGIPVPAAADSNAPLTLGRASLVEGTNVIRADLFLDRGGEVLSSKAYNEPRNILFIEAGQKEGHWLLPDNNHTVTGRSDISDNADDGVKRVVGTVVLVKPTTDSSEIRRGRLLLFNPSGTTVIEVANDVREIKLAALSGGDLTILFERDRHLVLAAFDPASLAKCWEQEVKISGSLAQATQ